MKIVKLIVLLLLLSVNSFAQNDSTITIILTNQQKNNYTYHKTSISYCLLEYNTTSKTIIESPIPIFLYNFSYFEQQSCLIKKNIRLRNFILSDSNVFTQEQLEQLINLKRIVKNKRVKIKSFKSKNRQGNIDHSTLYATVISGSFCKCKVLNLSSKTKYIRMPISDFIYDKTSTKKIKRNVDFDQIDFTKIDWHSFQIDGFEEW